MSVARTARRIALGAFLVYAATGGGRVVGSDEVSMLALSRALLHGQVAVPEGATLQGPDGRFYTKNAAGQAVLALPLVASGEAAAAAAHLPPARRELAVRFVASFFNAAIAALLLAVFYAAAVAMDVAPPAAFAGALLLGFTTPLWVYAKSFMAEPLQALGLLLALAGAALAEDRRWRRAGALGVLLAVSVKLSMLPLALLALLPLRGRGRLSVPFGIALGVALAGHLVYNLARFGTPLETGYGAQATPAAYTTPLWVGLYGLLVSSGKGVLWFAPLLALAPAGWRAAHRSHATPVREPGRVRKAAMGLLRWLPPALRPQWEEYVPERRHDALRRALPAAAAMWAGALLMYGTFEHWAGDGSFGPRYLVPLLPAAFLAVAAALEHPSRARRRIAAVLAVAGFLVQIGGVAIHFGAQMREAGDYPYTRALGDPRFMSDSHFNPAFSPIAGHWRMLVRNTREHLAGDLPRLALGGDGDARVGVSADDQRRLLHALDFWWLYAAYAGYAAVPLQAAAALIGAAGLALLGVARDRAERRA